MADISTCRSSRTAFTEGHTSKRRVVERPPEGRRTVESAGGYLREWFGEGVFTVGFFMGRGTIADNGRNQRGVAVPDPESIERFLAGTGTPASYVALRGNARDAIRLWASVARPYLRMGVDPRTMVPASEFDALLFIDRVRPPDYRVR